MPRNMHFLVGAQSHVVPELAQGAESYAAKMGQRISPVHPGVITPQMTKVVSRAYDALPMHDPAAEPAFDAMRKETSRQYEFLTGSRRSGGLGLNVQTTNEDPYKGPAEMLQDIFHNRQLKVFGTGGPGNEHPFFSNEENDQFRAVHDAFGHAALGRGFDRHGEEAAFQAHSAMYSPLARRALATETRGQNSAFITHGDFQPQKVALLPSRLSDPKTFFGDRVAAVRQAGTFQQAQFGGLLDALRKTQS